MHSTSSVLADPSRWPAEVGFIPFIGERYEHGIGGLRILLLGESHYIADHVDVARAGGQRHYTRYIFRDCERSGGRAWGTFFRRLDSVVARKPDPSDEDAAHGWSRVAFANYVQKPVGSSAGIRPDARGWDSGRRAFPLLLDRLTPDVILVIGRETFNHTPNEPGFRLGEIPAPRVPRALWEMHYKGGKALMSWVYHPSRPRDSVGTYVDIFNRLLTEAVDKGAGR